MERLDFETLSARDKKLLSQTLSRIDTILRRKIQDSSPELSNPSLDHE